MDPKLEIRNAFDKHASHYDQYAKIQHEIGQRLFERLDYLKIAPRRILDLGCGTGLFSRLLKKKYPKAVIVGCDLAFGMLKQAKKKQSFLSSWPLIHADMMRMPFATSSFDLVFANQTIHWGSSLSHVFEEINRVMSVNACLMFTTLGPDTFKEFNQAWSVADPYDHAMPFIDLHDVGDILIKANFLDPVVDQELLTCQFTNLPDLMLSLKNQGVRNINPARNSGLTGKTAYQYFITAYDLQKSSTGKYPLTYEVVYGHAWKGQVRQKNVNGEVFIPISTFGRSR